MTGNAFADRLSCRQVLNIMVILGFMLNYMLRVNLTIAIVSMVLPSNDSNEHSHSNESALMLDECVATAATNDLTPIDDIRTDVAANRVNKTNNDSSMIAPAFPQWFQQVR